MSDDPTLVRYTLSTDLVVNAMVNAMLQKQYLKTCDPAIASTKHIALQCGRAGCSKAWSQSVNAATGYCHPLFHMYRHHWQAPADAMEAAHAQMERLSSAGRRGTVEYVSPPPKATKKTNKPSATAPDSYQLTRGQSGSYYDQKRECLKDTAYMMASTYLPFRWFRSDVVQRWFTSLGSTFQPTIDEVKLAVMVNGQQVMFDTVKALSSSQSAVTLAVDSVTNVNHHKIYSVCLLHEGQPWFYGSWNIRHSEDLAAKAHGVLSQCVQYLKAHCVNVAAITTDNASTMVQLRRRLEAEFGILGVGCAAHLVHNSATYLIERLEPILKPFNVFLQQYKEDKKLRCALDDEDATVIDRPNTTRWSSYLYALQSIQRNRPQVDGLPDSPKKRRKLITADDWLVLDDVVTILRYWEKHNKIVQADAASLVNYFDAFVELTGYLKQLHDGTAEGITSTAIRGCREAFLSTEQYIRLRFNKMTCRDAVSAAAYLSKSKSVDFNSDVSTTHKFFKAQAVSLMKACQLDLPAGNVANQLIEQLGKLDAGEAPWKLEAGERSERSNTSELANAVGYFRRRLRYREEARLLASLALILLTITPSEASVERTFSKLKLQWTAKRNRLDVTTVDCLLQLQMNGLRLRADSDLLTLKRPSSKWWLVDGARDSDEQDDSETADDSKDDS